MAAALDNLEGKVRVEPSQQHQHTTDEMCRESDTLIVELRDPSLRYTPRFRRIYKNSHVVYLYTARHSNAFVISDVRIHHNIRNSVYSQLLKVIYRVHSL